MSDIHALKLQHCEEDCEELKKQVSSVEELTTVTSDRVSSLEWWRNGNGGKGAEIRLQSAEVSIRTLEDIDAGPRLAVMEADVKALQQITDASIRSSVTTALRERDRSFVAKIKAWGPIVAAGLTAIGFIIQSLVK